MALNKNPYKVFQETEQVAMTHSNLVSGIEPSEDKLLLGRLLSYFYKSDKDYDTRLTSVVKGELDTMR